MLAVKMWLAGAASLPLATHGFCVHMTTPAGVASGGSRPARGFPSGREPAGQFRMAAEPAGRRALLKVLLGAGVGAACGRAAGAFEAVPAAPQEGDCADCIGVKNGFLANCPSGTPTCASSQDDQGEMADWANAYAEPWIYEGTPEAALAKIKFQVQRLGGKVVRQTEDYLRCEFRAQTLPGQVDAIDDAEFYLTPDDATVQFRSARRPSKLTSSPLGDFGANKKRLETIRVALHWEKVPVLRNRKRAFMFFESPLDTFGPACNGIGCGEDVRSTEDLKRPLRFDNDPLAAPALPRPAQPDEEE